MLDLTVIILTYNEEIHIERCIRSVRSIARRVVVVDSESTDNTRAIAQSLGAEVFLNPWPGNQAAQLNWALDNIEIDTKWIFRIDADEYVPVELSEELQHLLPSLSDEVTGINLPRVLVWMEKRLKYTSKPIDFLRLFRAGYGRCEQRMMDEHIELTSGTSLTTQHYFVDDNLNNLNWWMGKHVDYATREAAELLDLEYNLSGTANESNLDRLNNEAQRKRKLKLKYARQPLFWRSFAYFLYRYLAKGGILEGKEGFLRHFLQGWWYRTFVDARIFEIKKACGNDPDKIKHYLLHHHNIKF